MGRLKRATVTRRGIELYRREGSRQYYARVRVDEPAPEDRPNTVRDLHRYALLGRFESDAEAAAYADATAPRADA